MIDIFHRKTENDVAQAERVSERCAAVEKRIAETAAAIAVATGKLVQSDTPDILLTLRSEIDFAQMRWRGLIEERLVLEEDRLAEIADDADAALNLDNPLPPLLEKSARLQLERDAVEMEIQRAQRVLDRLHNAKFAADQALTAYRSRRPTDKAQREATLRDLRQRLEGLGDV